MISSNISILNFSWFYKQVDEPKTSANQVIDEMESVDHSLTQESEAKQNAESFVSRHKTAFGLGMLTLGVLGGATGYALRNQSPSDLPLNNFMCAATNVTRAEKMCPINEVCLASFELPAETSTDLSLYVPTRSFQTMPTINPRDLIDPSRLYPFNVMKPSDESAADDMDILSMLEPTPLSSNAVNVTSAQENINATFPRFDINEIPQPEFVTVEKSFVHTPQNKTMESKNASVQESFCRAMKSSRLAGPINWLKQVEIKNYALFTPTLLALGSAVAKSFEKTAADYENGFKKNSKEIAETSLVFAASIATNLALKDLIPGFDPSGHMIMKGVTALATYKVADYMHGNGHGKIADLALLTILATDIVFLANTAVCYHTMEEMVAGGVIAAGLALGIRSVISKIFPTREAVATV